MASIGKWCVLAIALVLSGASARADDYPSHPIKLIVPYAPGGGADAVARIVSKRVSETIGQPIVIENRGGAGSIIGTEDVHKADPDGYTLLLGQSGPISINPARLQGPALRSGKRFRADHDDHGLSVYSRGQCQAAGRKRCKTSSPWSEPSPANSITARPASAPPIISSPNYFRAKLG